MSFNTLTAQTIAELLPQLPSGPTVVELGNQTFTATEEAVSRIVSELKRLKLPLDETCIRSGLEKSRATKLISSEIFYRAVGFGAYTAIDVNDRYGSLMMDLNRDLRADYGFERTFDLVTNNGTGEHVFNQAALFKNVHDLTKPGGFMAHVLPLNWVNHGFYNFNPVLFADLGAANGYRICKIGFADRWGHEISTKGARLKAPERRRGGLKSRIRQKMLELLQPPMKKRAFSPKKRLTIQDFLVPIKKKTKDSLLALAFETLRSESTPNLLLVAVLQKISDAPFTAPLQGKYSQTVESVEIRERYAGQSKPQSLTVPSVLSKLKTSDIQTDPFPHVVIRGVFEDDLYERLAAEFPKMEIVLDGILPGDNSKRLYSADKAMQNPEVSPLWKSFFETHTSPDFFREVVSHFGPHIRAMHPHLEPKLGRKLEDWQVGVRRRDKKADVLMDCQFAINSPASKPSSVRGPHTDGPKTLYACLFYFKQDGDDAGGDLEIYRFKPGVDGSKRALKTVDPELVELVKTIPYEKNTMIFFVNSVVSLHGVTVRRATPMVRRYVNVIADIQGARLYELNPAYAQAGAPVSDDY